MRDRPDALDDEDIGNALAADWEIDTTSSTYAPLGGGSYHWWVQSTDGRRWFVSATDLDHAPWLGATRSASMRTFRTTMDTALTLQRKGGLSFVLAPVPCRNGGTVRRVRERYGLVVHPFLDGVGGHFGAQLGPAEQSTVIDILADLHETPTSTVDLHGLVDLDPRETLSQADPAVGPILGRYDDLCEHLRGRALVITHGEPHAGNVMRSGERTYLIDWDTTALALPERDLWLLLDHGNTDVLRLYAERTGHVADPAALALYRLHWALEELVYAVRNREISSTQQAIHNAQAAAGL